MAPRATGTTFRRDIQGLRAVAVVLVVLYHADLGFAGGYVGVDVFFVLSGFLIGGLLLDELVRTDRISFSDFYARRVRRLLPAFALFAVATLALSIAVSSPFGAQQLLVRTVRASSVFAANASLYFEKTNYFNAEMQTNPFLHMWSLSVEEQFYLLLPVTLLVVWRLAGSRGRDGLLTVRAATIAVSLASFGLGVLLSLDRVGETFGGASRFAFYAMPPRAWELGAGVVLAIHGRTAKRGAGLVTGAGLALIAVASLVFDDGTSFPGVAAALPVAGAVMAIYGGAASSAVSRALSHRIAVWVGDRSYSWYLWHFPLIVFATTLFPRVGYAGPLAAAASIVPAAISFRYLEARFRKDWSIRGWRATRLAGACIALPIVAAAVVGFGASRRWGLEVPDGRTETIMLQCDERQLVCSWPVTGTSRGTIFVVGDSHARAASDGIVDAAHSLGYDVDVLWRSACPAIGRPGMTTGSCAEWQQDVRDAIDAIRPNAVVIANRSPFYVRESTSWATSSRGERGRTAALEAWSASLDDMLSDLDGLDIPALIFATVPEYEEDLSIDAVSLVRPEPPVPTLHPGDVARRRAAVLAVEGTIADRHRSATFDPEPYLCDDTCRPKRDGIWLYDDSDHLTPIGSRLLSDPLAAVLEQVLAP